MQEHRKFTDSELEEAVDDLEMLQFFPKESRGAVLTLLRKMVPHKTALTWLISECVNHIGKWPGPAELRGLLCTRYDPADGIDQWCSLPGYSAADAEAKTIAEHEQRKIQERVGGYVSEEYREILLSGRKVKKLQ
jgi:hypothetical protein